MKKILFFSVVGILLFQSQFYRLRSKVDLAPKHIQHLDSLGSKAIATWDVPVAALLFYKDSLIGWGYNTVQADGNLGGHAEINALNMAFKAYGPEFHKLDRKRLSLYTTYEPCEMCKGALLHYHVDHVYFEKPKPGWEQVDRTWQAFLYELSKGRFDADSLQENLFLKHPNYTP